MAEHELYEADAVAEVMRHLRADTGFMDELGGPDHMSGLTEGPWPHLVVSPGVGGSLRDLMTVIEPDVLLELVGPADGSVGSAALWRLIMRALVSIKGMPEREHVPGRPVVSFVRVTGPLAKQPLSSGQTRWSVSVSVSISPPQD